MLRRALYGGVFGSVGATTGWLLWLGILAVRLRPVEVAGAAVLGAIIGFAIEWFIDYVRVAREEAEHGVREKEDEPPPDEARYRPRDRGRLLAAGLRIGAVVAGFLGLVCEHLVSEVASRVLLPFLCSLIFWFPVGAIFAVAFFRDGGAGETFFLRIVHGLLAGVAAAVVTGLACFMMRQGNIGHGGWLVLVALGTALMVGRNPNAFAPFLGALAALVFFCLCAGYFVRTGRQPPIPFVNGSIGQYLVDDILVSPDIPSAFWERAEKEIGGTSVASTSAATGAWTLPCRWVGCLPPAPAAPAPANPLADLKFPPPSALALAPLPTGSPTALAGGGSAVPGGGETAGVPFAPSSSATTSGTAPSGTRGVFSNVPSNPLSVLERSGHSPAAHAKITPPWLSKSAIQAEAQQQVELGRTNEFLKQQAQVNQAMSRMLAESAAEAAQNQRRWADRSALCDALMQGWHSGLFRSWLVVLMFSVGFGASRFLDDRYYPKNHYEISETAKRDRLLMAIVIVVICVGIGVIRYHGVS